MSGVAELALRWLEPRRDKSRYSTQILSHRISVRWKTKSLVVVLNTLQKRGLPLDADFRMHEDFIEEKIGRIFFLNLRKLSCHFAIL